MVFDPLTRSFSLEVSKNSLSGSYDIVIEASVTELGFSDTSESFSLDIQAFDPITLSTPAQNLVD